MWELSNVCVSSTFATDMTALSSLSYLLSPTLAQGKFVLLLRLHEETLRKTQATHGDKNESVLSSYMRLNLIFRSSFFLFLLCLRYTLLSFFLNVRFPIAVRIWLAKQLKLNLFHNYSHSPFIVSFRTFSHAKNSMRSREPRLTESD